MPKAAFLVAASPNAGFYSQIAAINLALKALPWKRWEPEVYVTMGSRNSAAVSEDRFERWRPYVREVNFAYVSETEWERINNWAQVDSTFLFAPRNADAYVKIDADTLPVAGLEDILDEIYATQSIGGVMAHFPPPEIADMHRWEEIAAKIGVKQPICSSEYSLIGKDAPEYKRKAPIYFNGGVVFFAQTSVDMFVRPYIELRHRLVETFPNKIEEFSAQIAMSFAIKEAALRAIKLPMRFNYPNDDAAIPLHPGELENAVIFHYLRTHAFDRQKIFTSAGEYKDFLEMSLTGTNLAFQTSVRRILGPTYPFS